MIAVPPHLEVTTPAAVCLDGGMSNALADRGVDVSGPLWTARLLRDQPSDIAAVHRRYFEAGALVATTASYQASVPGFVEAGMRATEAEELLRSSVRLATKVRDELSEDGVRRWIAASVGPYGAVLADGSEYRGHYGLSRSALRDFHLPRIELLLAAEPDFLAVETIPDVVEVEVLVEILRDLGVPAWVSVSARGRATRAGQPLADAYAPISDVPSVFAAGVNCCAPRDVLPAVRIAAKHSGKPVVAYPNSGEEWQSGTWVGEQSMHPDLVPQWVEAGAAYVGGCCRVGPGQISEIARLLEWM